jgi:hypothetical protein
MASGEFAEPIYKLLDEGVEAKLILDNLVCYLNCDQIKDFVKYFRRHYELPEQETDNGDD